MSAGDRPVIAVTLGDAAGIGPEVIVKALDDKRIFDICRPLVIGDGSVLTGTIGSLGLSTTIAGVDDPAKVEGKHGIIELLDLRNLRFDDIVMGKVSGDCGKASMEYIARAAEMAQKGIIDAVTTAPINKESVTQAGYEDTGHMKYLTRITGTAEYAAMLVTGRLRAVHLSDHYSLKEACEMVKRDTILSKLRLIDASFRKWGFNRPCIGVAALNPHSSDGGLFGSEEEEEIAPAVKDARDMGIDARGPFPADTVFVRAAGGEFDAVLAMYHDQGHIAVKMHGFEKSVAVTLGLPFIRTSVDHGTAYDIAGKGIADSRSMTEAIITAVRLSREGRLAGDE